MRLIRTLVVGIAVLISVAPGAAKTIYVAANGSGQICSDMNPCSNVATAYDIAMAGDTIVCITPPRSFNPPITITVSITIDCVGARLVSAAETEGAGQGNSVYATSFIINLGANDPIKAVRLRGMTIDGGYSASLSTRARSTAIEIVSADAVYIEDCVISNMRLRGIYDHRTGGQTRLYVKDTVISGNGGPGIVAASQATAATVLDNVSLLNNSYGIATAAGNNVIINRSTISGNTIAGVEADGGAQVDISNSLLSHNAMHIQAFGKIRLRDNDLKFSNTAIQGAGAVSFGANRFSGNGTQGATPTLVSGAPADLFN